MSTSVTNTGEHKSRARAVAAAFAGLAFLGLTACSQPTPGAGTPASIATSTVDAQPSVTVVVPPPETVYVAPPETVTVPGAPTKQLTPCRQIYADGYSYELAYAAWRQAGFPPNWDADHDGYPCEQSYGEQN
jgi:hypothetical protein